MKKHRRCNIEKLSAAKFKAIYYGEFTNKKEDFINNYFDCDGYICISIKEHWDKITHGCDMCANNTDNSKEKLKSNWINWKSECKIYKNFK